MHTLAVPDGAVELGDRLAVGHGVRLDLGRHLEDAGGHGRAAGVFPRCGLAGRRARHLLGHHDALLEVHLRSLVDEVLEVVDDGLGHESDSGAGLDRAVDQAPRPVDDDLDGLGVVLVDGTSELRGVGHRVHSFRRWILTGTATRSHSKGFEETM